MMGLNLFRNIIDTTKLNYKHLSMHIYPPFSLPPSLYHSFIRLHTTRGGGGGAVALPTHFPAHVRTSGLNLFMENRLPVSDQKTCFNLHYCTNDGADY